LVANAVSVKGEVTLLAFATRHHGSLRRIHIERTRPVGTLTAWHSLATVTQLVAEKRGS